MPSSKEHGFSRSNSSNVSGGMANYAKVYHQATNLMPYTPPQTPTGMNSGISKPNTSSGWGRQNSCNGKYS